MNHDGAWRQKQYIFIKNEATWTGSSGGFYGYFQDYEEIDIISKRKVDN